LVTFTGETIAPFRGSPSLYSIGVGLGRTARFSGQTRSWYPVLAHTLVVARLVAPRFAIHALLHDAPEAVLGDTPSTLKSADREELEEDVLARIYSALELDAQTVAERDAVKRADLAALAAEAHVLGHATAEEHWPMADVSGAALAHTRHELAVCRCYLEADDAAAVFLRAVAKAQAARA
jgi:hypothetical protein